MLRLNWMLSKRLFRKCPPDDAGREVWYRADCTIYRYDGAEGKRVVRFDHKDETGRVWRTEIYAVDDPRAKEIIDKLSTPFSYSAAPAQRETLEDMTRRIANAFDKWFQYLANHPDRDIVNDKVTISFDNQSYDIPMYSVDFLDITQRYLDELNVAARENEW
jgi:hypothetical protein